jgi:hypothetical protein
MNTTTGFGTDLEPADREYAEQFRDAGLIWYYWAIHMEEVFPFRYDTEKLGHIIRKAHPEECKTMLAMFSEMTMDRCGEIFVSDAQPKTNPDLTTQVASIMFEALRARRHITSDDLDHIIPAEELGQFLQEYNELLSWVKENWVTPETDDLYFYLEEFKADYVNAILQFFAFSLMLPIEALDVLRWANMEKILLPDLLDDWEPETVANALAWENLQKLYTLISLTPETSAEVKLLKLFAVAHDTEITDYKIRGLYLTGSQFERLVQYGERYTGVFTQVLRAAHDNDPDSLCTALPEDWLYQIYEYGRVEGEWVQIDLPLWHWIITEAARPDGGKLTELGRN